MRSTPRRWWKGAALLLLLAACGDDCKKPPDFTPKAYEIVMTYAEPAFMLIADDEQHNAALQRFHEATAEAVSRADLAAAWQAEPVLDAQGADWLQRKIFARAEADADWPSEQAFAEQGSFVKATRDAIAARLQGGG